jgi:hypothetical protein
MMLAGGVMGWVCATAATGRFPLMMALVARNVAIAKRTQSADPTTPA